MLQNNNTVNTVVTDMTRLNTQDKSNQSQEICKILKSDVDSSTMFYTELETFLWNQWMNWIHLDVKKVSHMFAQWLQNYWVSNPEKILQYQRIMANRLLKLNHSKWSVEDKMISFITNIMWVDNVALPSIKTQLKKLSEEQKDTIIKLYKEGKTWEIEKLTKEIWWLDIFRQNGLKTILPWLATSALLQYIISEYVNLPQWSGNIITILTILSIFGLRKIHKEVKLDDYNKII